jgi:hypothetical protein
MAASGWVCAGRRRLWLTGLFFALLSLTSCGGGGNSGGNTGGGTGQGVVLSTPIVMDGGPAGELNVPFVSVTVCSPGTATCQTVDHVILDTGSTGLRLVASVLDSNLALPAETDGSGNPLRECYAYVTSYVWGSMVTADVSIAGQNQPNLPVHLIGDDAAGAPATQCTSVANADFASFINQATATSMLTNTVAAFGANGILGVSPTGAQDCGVYCAPGTTQSASFLANYYYSCPTSTTCAPTTAALGSQASNLIALLNGGQVNGIGISLPAVAGPGATTASGTLTLGVSTNPSDTPPGTATFYGLDPYAFFSTQLNNSEYLGIVDSGTAFYLFTDASITSCPVGGEVELYCPPSTLSLSATFGETTDVVHASGASGSVGFSIQNYLNVSNSSFVAPDIGTPCGLYLNGTCYTATATTPTQSLPYFIWGLPFYLGRTVYFVYPGATAGNVRGPAVGFF